MAQPMVRWAHRFLVFGALPRPSGALFLGRGRLHACLDDARGRWLRSFAGVTDPPVTWLWRRAAKLLRPSVALDVGANYGEVGLSARYPQGSRLYLFEPNPSVLEFLRVSAESHVDRDRIQIVPKAASDACDVASLTIDPLSSGRSSLSLSIGSSDATQGLGVETITIDWLLAEQRVESLIFKIDVEGHESAVLRGMRSTLERAKRAVGIVEFHTDHLTRAGETPKNTLSLLYELGIPASTDADGVWRPVRRVPQQERVHCNLLVVSDEGLLREFNLPSFIHFPHYAEQLL